MKFNRLFPALPLSLALLAGLFPAPHSFFKKLRRWMGQGPYSRSSS